MVGDEIVIARLNPGVEVFLEIPDECKLIELRSDELFLLKEGDKEYCTLEFFKPSKNGKISLYSYNAAYITIIYHNIDFIFNN